jgi:DNA topoisomerase VI subunit B
MLAIGNTTGTKEIGRSPGINPELTVSQAIVNQRLERYLLRRSDRRTEAGKLATCMANQGEEIADAE